MKEYMEKGEDGLPVKIDNDPEVTDENYKEKVKEEHRGKPTEGYELLLMKSIHLENSQKRKRKNSREEVAENKEKKVQPIQENRVINLKSCHQQ